MTLAHIAPEQRPVLRWHGWVIAAWALAVGWVANVVLRHAAALDSPMWRWPLSMLAMYGLGIVGGAYAYVRWWQHRQAAHPLRHATEPERLRYEIEREERERRALRPSDLDGLGLLAELFPPLMFIVAPLLVLTVVILFGGMPFMVTEAFGAFLAELLLEFVIGAVLARRVLQPRDMSGFLASVGWRTWWLGGIGVAMAALLGYAAEQVFPGASTLLEMIRAKN